MVTTTTDRHDRRSERRSSRSTGAQDQGQRPRSGAPPQLSQHRRGLRLDRDHHRLRDLGAGYVPDLADREDGAHQNAVAGLVALALIVPLSSRVFDLSVGNAVGLCNVIVAWLLVNQGMPMVLAIPADDLRRDPDRGSPTGSS